MRIRVYVQSETLRDEFLIPVREPKNQTVLSFLGEVGKRYRLWHSFPVYEFQLKSLPQHVGLADKETTDRITTFSRSSTIFDCFGDEKSDHDEGVGSGGFLRALVEETEFSVKRRKEDERKAEEERRRREEEARLKEKLRKKRIAELTVLGECWELEGISPNLDVPVDLDGMVVINKGSMDQWCSIR
eukprot:750734_1